MRGEMRGAAEAEAGRTNRRERSGWLSLHYDQGRLRWARTLDASLTLAQEHSRRETLTGAIKGATGASELRGLTLKRPPTEPHYPKV